MKNISYKVACTNCIPEDEPMRFKTRTCGRRQKLN